MCWRTRGEEGGHSWTELFTSNSLTPECCVSHMRGLWVSNQLCDREKHEFFFLLPLCALRVWQPYWTSTCQALYIFSLLLPHSLSSSHSHTRCLFVSPTPSFFHSIIYSSLCPGKVHPHVGGRGLAQGAQEENISIQRAKLAEGRGTAL